MSLRNLIAGAALATGLLAMAADGLAQQAGRGGQAQAPAPTPTGKAAVVRVTGGQVQGLEFGDVSVYRGIPFAAAPTGNLRWRAPQTVKAWSGVKDASANGAACTANEDCLYLNVFKPRAARPGAKLPTMVWIHGGAFTGGSGGTYDGTQFAKKDIVLVSINYRLGRMGWFSHSALTKNAPAGEAVGNYGLQDQIAALKWVKANAAAFGGDPANVTIFGESAGAISVNYLMVSPDARGLFHKAISQSGFGRIEPRPLTASEQQGQAFFDNLNIRGDTPATVAAMRAVPFDQTRGGLGLGAAGVIRDGKTVNTSAVQAFTEGKQARVPYILGGNSNEASLFPTDDPAARLAALTQNRAAMLAAYDPQGRGDAARIVNLIVTDQQITEGDRVLARGHVRLGLPTYAYYFSYLPPAQRATSLGLAHGAEIGYVFGRTTGSPEDLAIGQSANAYWAAFAKYGTPGAAGGPEWPKYDLQREARLEFGVDGPMVREQFAKARLDWLEQNRQTVIASAAAGQGAGRGAAQAGRGGRGGTN
jgi:para-nitrobenzyl esterase